MSVATTRDPLPLPHNGEIEQGLLAALLINNQLYYDIAEAITEEHFFFPAHAAIFRAIRETIERGGEANGFTLKNHFDADPLVRDVGGSKYVAKLMASPVVVRNAINYAVGLRDLHMRRRLVMIGESMLDRTVQVDQGLPADKLLEEVEAEFFRLSEAVTTIGARGTRTRDFRHRYFEEIDRAIKAGGAVVGVPTSIIELDDVLGGLHDTDLIVLAGRPGTGKTALACTVVRKAAEREAELAAREGRRPRDIGFFSLEMSQEQLLGRLVAAETGISVDRQRRGQIGTHDVDAMNAAADRLEALPIVYFDRGRVGSAYIRRHARRLKRRGGLLMIVVDHLQLMAQAQRFERKQLEVADIVHDLKAVAKELGVPVLLLSQLSRKCEERTDKRPVASDLRESGDIEQDADQILLLFREEMYLQKPLRSNFNDDAEYDHAYNRYLAKRHAVANLIEIIIGKNRHGPMRTVAARFDGDRQTIESLDHFHTN